MSLVKAVDLVDPWDKTVAIFTHGRNMKINPDGTGYSGKWVISEERLEGTKKVILYLRNEGGENQLYVGNYIGNHQSDEPRRLVVNFSGLKPVGTTDLNWLRFAEKGQSPIVIINNEL